MDALGQDAEEERDGVGRQQLRGVVAQRDEVRRRAEDGGHHARASLLHMRPWRASERPSGRAQALADARRPSSTLPGISTP